MIKRVNFTGRKRIPRDRISIEVFDGEPRTFDASIDVSDLGFLGDAEVVIEATCAGSSLVKRFEFGTVENHSIPPDRELSLLTGKNIIFGVKVIDRTKKIGSILGICKNANPVSKGKQTASGRQGILPVELAPLGDELWKIEFKEHNTFLLINEDIPELRERMRYDPSFKPLILPEIIRKILNRAIEENVDIEEEEDDDRWPIIWLRFGQGLHSDQSHPPFTNDAREVRDEWIDDVVVAFCREHSLKQCYLSAQSAE